MPKLNPEVTTFLNGLNHPLRTEIEALRHIILSATEGLSENIKWNGPNYTFGEADRITMKIQPPKQIQLIFHRGAKKLEQPKERIIQTDSNLLTWKGNDRAVVTCKELSTIENAKTELTTLVAAWIRATKS